MLTHRIPTLVIGLLALCLSALAAESAGNWSAPTLAEPRAVELSGATGEAYRLGIARLAQPPYTKEWLLADVSFEVSRIFTNYSGDVSGRFLELASLTGPAGRPSPATLEPVAAEIGHYQKADGHFGADMDFAAPMGRNAPPIPMLWGNGRLLVGLVTAARELSNSNLLTAARRLGDFYVATAPVFCSPAREAELKATGTGGDGYTCCYFPAIEGLALLYRTTQDRRYLEQAERMAEWFKKFDALPTDHSHGNLCAWRGMLELYQITGNRDYLGRALAKWKAAVENGFVWTLGGIGEHWYVFHSGDEGCSESDWLRFNLELWRDTGETRFLDLAERLLWNQYSANQCPNGGYGWRPFDGDAAVGPIGTRGPVQEWNFCCSFHGPLGLHFLKTYLAAGSERGLYVNFPLDFRAAVRSGGRDWTVSVAALKAERTDQREYELQFASAGTASTTLWIRRPDWALEARLLRPDGAAVPFTEEHSYMRVTRPIEAGEKLRLILKTGLRVEARRFRSMGVPPDQVTRLRDVVLLDGPEVLFARPAPAAGRLTLLAQVDPQGRVGFWTPGQTGRVTVGLPGVEATPAQVATALETGPIALVGPERDLHTQQRVTFAHDLVVVPAGQVPQVSLEKFASRAPLAPPAPGGEIYGEHLERRPEVWVGAGGWEFTANGLRVTGGDVGLLDGPGGGDYRFEFDLELPTAGQGTTGWVVRAADPNNCLMFQLQSADSTLNLPEFKTRPNTLRPHTRRDGQWAVAEPVTLPKQIRRGEPHHVAVDCRGPQITVFLDGDKVYAGEDAGFRRGTVGFRATSPAEQGLFRNVALRKL